MTREIIKMAVAVMILIGLMVIGFVLLPYVEKLPPLFQLLVTVCIGVILLILKLGGSLNFHER